MRTAFDRASFGVTAFSNRYDDFIETTDIGFNPRTRLLEFQSQNLQAATIKGVELRGEAHLTDRVMLRGSYARIEGVEILKDAAVPALAEETPLGSIAPNEGVLGIRYVQPSGRWGTELSLRLVESYQGAPDDDQFASGHLPARRPGEPRFARGGSRVSYRRTQPDGREILRVVERPGSPGERPGD